MYLDVRACNLPAKGLYTHLGFVVDQKMYPSYIDWHGGYSMSADTSVILEKTPPHADLSAL